jgi:DNA-binding transcriptional LysR family regulator
MTFRQLQYILAVVENGSISRAAQKLFISQPALSQHILKIEEELDARIFDRSTTPLSLTDAGNVCIEMARKALFEYDQCRTAIDDVSNLRRGHITIGIPDNRSVQILPYVLPEFVRNYPGIEIQLWEARASDLDQEILKGNIDFSMMVSASGDPKIKFEPLIKENLYLAVPSGHPLVRLIPPSPDGTTVVDFALCGDYPFFLMKTGHRLRAVIDYYFKKYDISPPIVMETSNALLTYRMTAAGLGLSLVSQLTTSFISNSVSPAHYALPPSHNCWTIGVNYHADKYVSNAMRVFIDCLNDTMTREPFNRLPV